MSEARSASRAVWIRTAAAVLVLAVAIAVLGGWFLRIAPLKSVLPGLTTMKANTAFGLGLAATALLVIDLRARWTRALVAALALALGILAALTLFEYLAGVQLGIDEWLVQDPASTSRPFNGRMAPLTAVGLMSIAASLALLALGRRRRAIFAGHLLNAPPAAAAFLSLAGYAFDRSRLTTARPYLAVALHTGVAFGVLAVGLLCVRPNEGWRRRFVDRPVARAALRQIATLAISVPAATGLIVMAGIRAGYYQAQFAPALFSAFTAAALMIVAFRAAVVLAGAEEALAQARGESHRATGALAQSRHRHEALVEGLPQLVWTARDDGWCDYLSRQWVDYTGIPEADQLGSAWLGKVIHPDDAERTLEHWMGAVAGQHPYDIEYRIRGASDEYRWFKVRGLRLSDPGGHGHYWFGTCTDIQEIVEAREVLARSRKELEHEVVARTAEQKAAEARRRAAFETSYILQWIVGLDGAILEANATSLAVIQKPLDAVVNAPFSGAPWFASDPEMVARVDAAVARVAAGAIVREEMMLEAPTGPRCFDFSMRPIRSAAGDVAAMVAEAVELTERRHVEAQLRQAQKMEAVGQLTGGIAHDFNNLLTGITGSLELLGTRVAQGRFDAVDRYLIAARGAAQRAAALTQRLLAFSRRQTLDPKPTDVNRLISGMEELIRRSVGPQIELETVGAAGLWPTLVDAPQLENALLNLCINARDAMPQGGRITVETANTSLDAQAAMECELPAGQYISLCVTDNGVGMTPEVIARAFDPFFTTKPMGEGTGLGLSMIYGFARQSGGQVRIYSEVGSGTTMCLYLPRHFGSAGGPDPTPDVRPTAQAHDGQTVLVIDDEPTVRMLVVEVLTDAGYYALEAADGAQGLEILRSDARIDLLITDVGLPSGLNGRQVADAARALRPKLDVLFITGYAQNAAVGNGHLDPGMELLTKPFSIEALASKIAEMIGRRPV